MTIIVKRNKKAVDRKGNFQKVEDLWQETRVRNKIKWSCLSVLRLADEKSYKSLRKALDVIKHNKRHEKWEVVKPKPKEKFEAPPPPESPAKNYESFSSVQIYNQPSVSKV